MNEFLKTLPDDQLKKFVSGAYSEVQGWLQQGVVWSLAHVARFQREHGIQGDSCEIGVHHGRFFLALENVTPEGARCYAIDVFDDQELNIDRSGSGSEQLFRANVDKFAIDPTRVDTVRLDSTTAEAQKLFRGIEGTVGLFSVDGGHTRAHVLTDLHSAEVALSQGGVVYLDDYFNPDWPSVVEGLFAYLHGPHRLWPVATVGGKLILASMSYADRLMAHLRKACMDEKKRAKWVNLAGYQFLSIRLRS